MHSTDQKKLLTTHLFALFLRCPFRDETTDCPFSDIRKLDSLEMKYQIAEQMANDPSFNENVHNIHEACYSNRMQQVVHSCQKNSATQLTQKTKDYLYPQAVMGQL
ncbi:MAG: hypothetical protein HGB26_07985 [Desulfobulbaceae bacterium]|nr:hypothetical protein [Desulfobulbaceae bacterium]